MRLELKLSGMNGIVLEKENLTLQDVAEAARLVGLTRWVGSK